MTCRACQNGRHRYCWVEWVTVDPRDPMPGLAEPVAHCQCPCVLPHKPRRKVSA